MIFTIIGTQVSITSPDLAVQHLGRCAHSNESRHIYIANVHILMEDRDSQKLHSVISGADLDVPDGIPLVWMMWANVEWMWDHPAEAPAMGRNGLNSYNELFTLDQCYKTLVEVYERLIDSK